jgi:hypothetical protein
VVIEISGISDVSEKKEVKRVVMRSEGVKCRE